MTPIPLLPDALAEWQPPFKAHTSDPHDPRYQREAAASLAAMRARQHTIRLQRMWGDADE